MKRPPRSTEPAAAASHLGRRELLGSAALAGAALLGCRPKKDPYRIDKPPVPRVPGWRTGEERWVLSTCALCEAACGIKVRVVEGRAVKIEGNPEHPVNRGGLCSRGQAALQALYHPERVRSPLRRTGSRGSGQWKTISWDEAIGEVTAKLAKLRAAGGPERLVLIDGETGTLTHNLWARFLLAYGSPNHVGMGSTGSAAVELDTPYRQGLYGWRADDLERTGLLLAMGTDLLASSGQAMHLQCASRARRPRVICVSPRRPGCRVDEWIPIAPGGYGALALALVHVLLRDALVDSRGFEALPGAGRTPEETTQVTGIPAETVERLAHALAENRPALVASDGSVVAASNGLSTAIAISALNGLLGERERLARVLGTVRMAGWPAPTVDALAAARRAVPRVDGAGTAACPFGQSRVQALPAAIASAKPYPVEALLVRGANPLATLPGRQAWAAALQRVPFVVSFSPWLDETAWLADLVLPESLFLEAWDMVWPAAVTDPPVLSLRQPVVGPVHGTRQSGDLVLALAAGLGGSIGSALPWKRQQDVVETSFPPQSMAAIKEKGAGRSVCADDENCKHGLGEIVDLESTTPHEFAFFARRIASAGTRDGTRSSEAAAGSGLPPWEAPRFSGDPLQFPLHLVPYRPAPFVADGAHAFPWLSELPLVSGNPWPLRAEINPADAARFGVADGDEVLVESSVGSCAAVALVSDGVRPGVVAMALGKSGVVDLVVPDEDRLSGLLAWQGTRVRLRRAS